MKRKLLLFLTLCAVIDVSAQTANLILNVSNTIEDGNIIRNVITLDERSTLPSNDENLNLKFVVYRFFSGYNLGGEIAALIGTPIVSTDGSGNTIYTFYMEGYQYWETNLDCGDCYNLEKEFYTTNHPVIVKKKANGQWDFTKFVLMDCFEKSTLAYHGTVRDYDNGGIYSYRMEMGAINVPSDDGTKGVYNNNGSIYYKNLERPNGTTSFTSNLVGVKLINPQINSQDQANSNVLTLGNTYTKDEVDADVDFSSENALKALTGDMAFNLVAKQTEPDMYEMAYPFRFFSNEIQEESIKSYHLVIYADDAQTVIYEKEQNVTESDGDILDQPELQWLTLLEQNDKPFSQGLLMDLEITTQNKYGKTNVYKAAQIWLESTSMQVNYDHMLVSGKWNEPDGTKQGYQVTINTQGNWGGDNGNVNYPAPTVQGTYKWRVWRVTDTETKLIDFDNLEGKDWGASYEDTSESGQGSSFSLTDIYVDKALGTGSTQSKKVKYVVRYYTERYSKGVELPSSFYVIPDKLKLTTDLSNPNQAGAPAVAAPAPANVQALAPRRAPAGYSDLNQYCVAEKQIEVEYTNEIPTGINELMAGTTGEVKQVRYYNVAGVESATPFDGLNIVVSHMADGSQKVTKIVR